MLVFQIQPAAQIGEIKMLSMRISNVINNIVEQELIGKGRENEALYINIDARLSYHTNFISFNKSVGLHLIYHCIPRGRVVSVFSGLTESCFSKLDEVEEWKHETTHDSCWRDIGIFSEVYFNLADAINEQIVANGRDKVAPKEMTEYNSFRDGLFNWVPVNITTDILDSYKKSLLLSK